MNHTIQIANILLTRRCNLRCNYCSIVRNYSDMPDSYFSMDYYDKHELSGQQWIDIIDRLHKNNPKVFLIFYGGEPFLYKDLHIIIDHCNKNNIYYTIISNNTKDIQSKIIKLYNKVGILKGFSASIDPDLYTCLNSSTKDHAIQKTVAGFENLCKLKEMNMADDVVAEMTVTSQNYMHVYDTVKLLSDNNIYSDITVIDMKKSPYYDFSNITDSSLLVHQHIDVYKQLVKKILDNRDKLKVHVPDILNDIFNILPCNMYCEIYKDLHNVSIDADGSFRLCLRIKGTEIPKLFIDDVINDHGNISEYSISKIEKDYLSYCKGCNHNCIIMSKKYSSGVVCH